MPIGRHDPTQKVDEVWSKERVTRQVREPECSTFHDLDVDVSDIEELLEEHWPRQ
jgi:hypothetical protein